LDPLAGMRDNGLTHADVQGALFVCNSQQTLENQRELIELRRLTGLYSAARAAHLGVAYT